MALAATSRYSWSTSAAAAPSWCAGGGRPTTPSASSWAPCARPSATWRPDPADRGEIAAVRAEAAAAVDDALATFGAFDGLVGVAGTITTLVAIELGGYDRDRVHHHVLTRATVERLIDELAALPLERRREVPGLEPERARVIVAGAVIAAAVLDSTGRDRMVVSERDLLDGVALAAWDPSVDLFRL